MSVAKLTDRVEATIQTTLETKAAPDDQVEWSLEVCPVEDEAGDHETMFSFFVTLACPEMSQEGMTAQSVAHVYIPIHQSADFQVAEWVSQVWDQISFARLASSLD